MAANAPVILIADLDLTSTRPLRVELRRRAARVLMASTAEQAVQLAELFPPDFILLDGGLRDAARGDLVTLFQTSCPRAEILLLAPESAGFPSGAGLGLLFSSVKPVSNETLLEVMAQACPRLRATGAEKVPAPTVLCVDDDRRFLQSLSRLLSRHGYKVAAFDDPRGALDALREVAPDCAVVDVAMPGLDGLAVTDAIRREYRDLIPVVLLSAKDSQADVEEGMKHGAKRYLTKPCEPWKLLDVVDYYAADLDPQERELLEPRM